MTPHVITMIEPNGLRSLISPSGRVIRLREEIRRCGEVDGLPVWEKTIKGIEDLPSKMDGVFYIVSSMVAQAVHRDDFLVPNAVRNESRQVTGCNGFFRIIGGTK
jgi:hypothetical protein